jgi:hypothetical protein
VTAVDVLYKIEYRIFNWLKPPKEIDQGRMKKNKRLTNWGNNTYIHGNVTRKLPVYCKQTKSENRRVNIPCPGVGVEWETVGVSSRGWVEVIGKGSRSVI